MSTNQDGTIATNVDRLPVTSVQGEIAPPYVHEAIAVIGYDGAPHVLPSVGGVSLNVRVGANAFTFVGDHLEPGVSTRHPDEKINAAYNVYACVGNTATVISGDAKGEIGVVTGKHGGIEHVIIDFAPAALLRMAIGDRVGIRSVGLGMELQAQGDVRVVNCDPTFFSKLGAERRAGRVHIPVAKIVPAAIMGSGLGGATTVRGDYDIQMFDPAMVERYALHELRLGDIVAIENADHTFGRIYRTGSMSVGIVSHGSSVIAGHGPGITSLLTSASGAIEPHLDSGANIAAIFGLL